VDVLKAEFPAALRDQPDEAEWAEACAELTAASQAPWILLSASVSFETYLRQVVVACEQGASGVAVGRAVWQEAVLAAPAERVEFLAGTAAARLARLAGVCDALAHPWTDWYTPQAADSRWYQSYLA
jgi:tagatose-1,6-bisphosphate aldolase